MNKLYFRLSFLVIIFAFAITGCKVDPVLIADGKPFDQPGGGIANSSINYTIDGNTIKLTTGFFQVIPADQDIPTGNIQIGGGLDINTAISISASTTVVGTFDADVITLGTSYVGTGKVTFTEINTTNTGLKGTVKGSFTGTLINVNDQSEKSISGSFSIKM